MSLILGFFRSRKKGVLCGFIIRLDFVNSLVAPVKADPRWAPFTALRYKELGLPISAREVDLPISLRLTDSVVKHTRRTSITNITVIKKCSTVVKGIHMLVVKESD